jgi:hypothetical protein
MKNEGMKRGPALSIALSVAFAVAAGGPASAADVAPSAAAVASVDKSMRGFLAAHLAWAGQQLGLAVDTTGLAYASTRTRTLAGATIRDARSLADIRSGAPFLLWYVQRQGKSPDYYTASLSPSGAAVLKDSRGAEVARGTARLGFTVEPTGYCEFDPDDGNDTVCLHCSNNIPDDWGGPFTWDVCFTI